MLKSVWKFCGGFFFDNTNQPESKGRKRTASRLRSSTTNGGVRKSRRAAVKRLRIEKPGAYRQRGTVTDLNGGNKKPLGRTGVRETFPSFAGYLSDLFSNGASDVDELRQLHSDFTLSRGHNIPESGVEDIKRRLENSELLKRKLNELRYDKRQLEKLEQNTRESRGGQYSRSYPIKRLHDDRVLLLQRENRILKRDLGTRERELSVANERIRVFQDQNRRLIEEIDRLRLELERARAGYTTASGDYSNFGATKASMKVDRDVKVSGTGAGRDFANETV